MLRDKLLLLPYHVVLAVNVVGDGDGVGAVVRPGAHHHTHRLGASSTVRQQTRHRPGPAEHRQVEMEVRGDVLVEYRREVLDAGRGLLESDGDLAPVLESDGQDGRLREVNSKSQLKIAFK